MLSNLLLVMGMCFFFGGINRLEQNFNVVVAQTAASLLALSAGCLLIPTAFTWSSVGTRTDKDEKLSRGTAIIMLIVYGSYLIFQLKSHKEIYNAPSQKVEKRKGAKKGEGESIMALAHAGAGQAAHIGGAAVQNDLVQLPEEEEEDPQLSLWGALITLAVSTALVGVCAEFLVGSINEVTCEYKISQYFVGLILLPIVGNAAEHATAVTVAIKDKMDLAIGVAVGSSMQIALLVLPLMVVLGWIMGKDMTLVFDDVSFPNAETPHIVLILLTVPNLRPIRRGPARQLPHRRRQVALDGRNASDVAVHHHCRRFVVLPHPRRRQPMLIDAFYQFISILRPVSGRLSRHTCGSESSAQAKELCTQGVGKVLFGAGSKHMGGASSDALAFLCFLSVLLDLTHISGDLFFFRARSRRFS